MSAPYDARSLANWVLDAADFAGRSLTNMDLNKIVFFLHTNYISLTNKELLVERIEAWHYGPVIREIYTEFEKHKSSNVTSRAYRYSFEKGGKELAIDKISPSDLEILDPILSSLLKTRTWDLVHASHEEGGAWDAVYNAKAGNRPGMEITRHELICAIRDKVRH